MKLGKARLNLLVDVATGIAFLVEVVSGFVLWLVLPHGGYQGGRNPLYGQTFILSRDGWLTLHDWFAPATILGVLVHLALRWRWIYHMLRGVWREAFSPLSPKPAAPESALQ